MIAMPIAAVLGTSNNVGQINATGNIVAEIAKE